MANAFQEAMSGPGLNRIWGQLQTALKRGEIALALGVICILVVLILPMPAWLLDISLALSITVSVLVLMTSLFISKPLDFSSFPTVLLIATILRLSLNLASTRLILSHGHEGTDAAGHVIEAFGNFVMGGNFVIGVIVFAILVLVNFVVITKGSGRIAEVSARFSLDAMPGKQMAIDADLSAGLIDEAEARARRKALEDESSFFGAMDGAAKFVRGDAVAGLIITFINVIGGMIIGVGQEGLSFSEAAHSYTILTVGDGLVTQIPAIVISTGAGLLVSKAGISGTTDKALFSQLGGYPAALGLVSFLMGSMALLPGIPTIPFLALSGAAGTGAWMLARRQAQAKTQAEVKQKEEAATPAEETIQQTLQIDTVRLELGYGLLSLIGTERGQKLTDQIKALRRQVAREMGFVLPAVRIQDNLQLPANTYVVRVKEIEAGRGDLRPNMILVMDPRGEKITIAGEETVEPTFGLPAMWIDPAMREEAMFRGYTVVDPATVVTTHLTEVVKDNMAELMSYAETQKLVEDLGKEHQKLIGDLIPAQISMSGVQRVLQNLLAERISIRDLPAILEGVSEACGYTRNVNQITEHVRARLSRQISDSVADAEGVIQLLALSPEWEQAFAESLRGDGEDKQLAMPPTKLQQFINAVRQQFERHAMRGETPVLLTSPAIRPFVRSIVERFRPVTVVMSQNEIYARARIKTVGQI
ncbi:flagellar biosynthesis protein FlhA [Hypericibacter adhaerens]|jgi:flagellar biosynthesis protein FlhA|uniref:Flagellar biosynthesis protein FlhA n=4 Tax=Hypericibacter adhaerens TaxID=2602016 RepID=A0A5J6N232_9PROT|nr:flagellar biosynthesis protein FlhA [Hypericibacter adhaerens]